MSSDTPLNFPITCTIGKHDPKELKDDKELLSHHTSEHASFMSIEEYRTALSSTTKKVGLPPPEAQVQGS